MVDRVELFYIGYGNVKNIPTKNGKDLTLLWASISDNTFEEVCNKKMESNACPSWETLGIRQQSQSALSFEELILDFTL